MVPTDVFVLDRRQVLVGIHELIGATGTVVHQETGLEIIQNSLIDDAHVVTQIPGLIRKPLVFGFREYQIHFLIIGVITVHSSDFVINIHIY